jgi:hypothetical protein
VCGWWLRGLLAGRTRHAFSRFSARFFPTTLSSTTLLSHTETPRARTGHNARIFDVAPAPPASTAFAGWVASASEDDAVRVWRPAGDDGGQGDFSLAASFRGHSDPVLRVAWHPAVDETRALASASGDRTARVWRLVEREAGDGGRDAGRWAAVEVGCLAGHAEEVYACEFLTCSPSSADAAAFRLVTASGPGLETWEVRPDGGVARLAAGPPCRLAAHAEEAGSGAGGGGGAPPPTPERWAAAHIFGAAVQPSAGVASPSRPLIAAACSDGSLRLWAVDAAAGCGLAPVFGVRAWVARPGVASAVAWSPCGAAVALTATDGRAAVFDVRRPDVAAWRGDVGPGGAAYGCAFVGGGGGGEGGGGGGGGSPAPAAVATTAAATLAVAAGRGVALFDVSAPSPAPAPPVGWLLPARSPPRRFLCVAAGGGGGSVFAAGEAVEEEGRGSGEGGVGGGGGAGRGVLWSTADGDQAAATPGHAKRSLWAPVSVFCPVG